MKQTILLLILLFLQNGYSQTEDAWVFFTDKPQANSYLSNPLSMLSQRALDRRTRLGISLDILDVPVDDNYLNQIKQTPGITYKAKSKWLNAVHITGTQADIDNLLNFSFVNKIEYANKNIGVVTRPQPYDEPVIPVTSRRVNFDYGQGAGQINLMHGEVMHQQNYTGDGVLIGILDAGFMDVDIAPLFQHLFQNNKILDVYNFVSHDTDVYQFSMHGSGVLSTIAAKTQGELVGTAPDVSVALYVSEDVSQEMPIEETYWAAAAERADSLGVDVINTSLGYQTYDRPEYSYTMADLDGQTSFISRAADIAVSRGINVVIAAGNSNGTPWPKIGMPADAVNVITVGAVDASGTIAGFSSIGPTADGRIKPDITAQGVNCAVYWNGQVQGGSGTSFASPIIAGMVACMVQAFPQKTPAQIKQDLISISDRYNNPDYEYGYGIPDFTLYNLNNIKNSNRNAIVIYPNPASDYFFVKSDNDVDYQIFTIEGKYILSGKSHQKKININQLSKGLYFVKIGNSIQKLEVN